MAPSTASSPPPLQVAPSTASSPPSLQVAPSTASSEEQRQSEGQNRQANQAKLVGVGVLASLLPLALQAEGGVASVVVRAQVGGMASVVVRAQVGGVG